MIRGDLLSYNSVQAPWYTVTLDNTTIRSLLTSVLVTIISYQAAAMMFDLFLGMKRKKESKVKMIGVLMLAWKSSSPLNFLNSVLRLDWITRLYYKGDIPKDTRIAREGNRVKVATVIMVTVLVFATPIIDIIFVALTLSKTKVMSFSEAGFGAVRFGFQENLQVLDTVPYLTSCKLAKFENRPTDFIDARFSICSTPTLPADPRGNLTGLEVVISGNFVQIIVIVRGIAAVSSAFSELQTKEGSFFIKPGLTESSKIPLVEMAREALAVECGEMSGLGPLPRTVNGSVISLSFGCDQASTTSQPEMGIATMLQERLTLIPSDEFLVVPSKAIQTGSFIDASKLQFLQRSEPTASTFTLICVTVVIVVVRLVSSCILSNDVGDGLEYIIKSRFGLRECDSMFWLGEERVYFRRKFQNGDEAHLGLHREGVPEVKRFCGGNLGNHEPFLDRS